MSNRFTATEKWDKSWFCSLTPSYKLFFMYLCDNCNNAGIWDVNWAKVKFYIWEEGPLDPKVFGCRDDGQPRVIEISKSKWFIRTFIFFQQKIKSLDELNPDNNAHKHIIKILEKEGVFNVTHSKQTTEGLLSPCQAPAKGHDWGTGIGKGKVKVKEGVVGETDHPEFDYLKNEQFCILFNDYLDMRRKIRKPATKKAQELVLKKLHKHDLNTAVKMVEQSIENSWQGIFPLKTDISKIASESRNYDQLIEEGLGKIATKDMIKKVLERIPEKLWWKVDSYLKKRYPGGGNGFGESERELRTEQRNNITKLNKLTEAIGEKAI